MDFSNISNAKSERITFIIKNKYCLKYILLPSTPLEQTKAIHFHTLKLNGSDPIYEHGLFILYLLLPNFVSIKSAFLPFGAVFILFYLKTVAITPL